MSTTQAYPEGLPPWSPPSYPTFGRHDPESRHVADQIARRQQDEQLKELSELVDLARLQDFLSFLVRDGSVNLACQSAKLEPTLVYELADKYPAFAATLKRIQLRGLKVAMDANVQAIIAKTHAEGELKDYHALHKVLEGMYRLVEGGISRKVGVKELKGFESLVGSK